MTFKTTTGVLGLMVIGGLYLSTPDNDVKLLRIEGIAEDLAVEARMEEKQFELTEANKAERTLASEESSSVSVKYSAILKDSKFKIYKDISLKVIVSKEEKEKYRMILTDEFLLRVAVDLMLSNSDSFSHELEVAHLEVSQFLLEAIKLNGKNAVVVEAVKRVLSVNLSEQETIMDKKSYNLLKEDKAEIMYSVIASNKQIAKWYSPNQADLETQKIYENINNRYESNNAASKRMISQR